MICGGPGISDAFYCRECTQEEKDRDGCPKIVNLGASKTDLFYERKKYGFKRYVLEDRVTCRGNVMLCDCNGLFLRCLTLSRHNIRQQVPYNLLISYLV